MPLLCGLSCNRVLVIGRAMGVQLKSNSPFSCAYANSLGFNLDGRRRLSVIYSCSSRQSQFCFGKSGSVTQSHAMK